MRLEGVKLFLTGIEKNGELVDHIEDRRKHLPERGAHVALAPATDEAHFFDGESGERLQP